MSTMPEINPCGKRSRRVPGVKTHIQQKLIQQLLGVLCCIAVGVPIGPVVAAGDEPVSFDTLSVQYEQAVRPLLKRFCLDCHSTELKEGELDLDQFVRFDNVRLDPEAWQKVDEMLAGGEMPPEDSEQLSVGQQKQLRGWVRS